MRREVKKYLFDIKTSVESIYDFLGEKRDFYEYQNNKLLRRGIEREIEIIGEAVNKLMKIAPEIRLTLNIGNGGQHNIPPKLYRDLNT